jgi:hypothetical protein
MIKAVFLLNRNLSSETDCVTIFYTIEAEIVPIKAETIVIKIGK